MQLALTCRLLSCPYWPQHPYNQSAPSTLSIRAGCSCHTSSTTYALDDAAPSKSCWLLVSYPAHLAATPMLQSKQQAHLLHYPAQARRLLVVTRLHVSNQRHRTASVLTTAPRAGCLAPPTRASCSYRTTLDHFSSRVRAHASNRLTCYTILHRHVDCS